MDLYLFLCVFFSCEDCTKKRTVEVRTFGNGDSRSPRDAKTWMSDKQIYNSSTAKIKSSYWFTLQISALCTVSQKPPEFANCISLATA